MTLSPRDKREIADMIARAVSAAGARADSDDRISDGLREVAEHSRMLVLPGAHKSRFVYFFLLDEDFRVLARVAVRKRAMRDMLLREVKAHGRDLLLDGAAVVLEGEFPVTRAVGSRR